MQQTKQMKTSEETKARLEQELAKRNSELEKINTLDDKITVELSSLNEKIAAMLSEMQQVQRVLWVQWVLWVQRVQWVQRCCGCSGWWCG